MPKLDSGKATLIAAAELAAHRLVKLTAAGAEHNSAAAADDPIGVTEYLAAAGDPVMVRLLADPGLFEIEAAGAIAAAADVYAADAGQVQALPVDAGDYRRVGKAMDASTGAGDVIRVMPYAYTETKTVS